MKNESKSQKSFCNWRQNIGWIYAKNFDIKKSCQSFQGKSLSEKKDRYTTECEMLSKKCKKVNKKD